MASFDISRMFELIRILNQYRYEYYDLKVVTVSDSVYDKLYEELIDLQIKTRVYMANSPSMYPGYPPVSKLETVYHLCPKTKAAAASDTDALTAFQMQKQIVMMPNILGVPVQLTYENCSLQELATRTTGTTGTVVTHNVCSIAGIPMVFDRKDRLVVAGILFIGQSAYDILKQKLLNRNRVPYTNIEEMIFDAVHLLDPMFCRKCQLQFLATEVLEGLEQMNTQAQKLGQLIQYGFTLCPLLVTSRPLTQPQMESGISRLQNECRQSGIPTNGTILLYNDLAFSSKCGTAGFPAADRIAFLQSFQQANAA